MRKLMVTAIGFLCSLTAFAQLTTNAREGVFPQDQRFWFSVGAGERLVLRVDGNETYRGAGPAQVLLSSRSGDERSYDLRAERRSALPEDAELESMRYAVTIDAAPPAPPSLSASSGPGDSWAVSAAAEPGAVVRVAFDSDGVVSELRDPGRQFALRGRRVAGLAWAVDKAGNASDPVPFSFEPFSLSITNPVPGFWLNRQRLVVEAAGTTEIFWTDDGSDPAGPAARRYDGPAIIERAGSVVVRVAARSPAGEYVTASVAYSVADALPSALVALAYAEAAPVVAEAAFDLPEGSSWDIGSGALDPSKAPRFAGPASVTLRPVRGVSRVVPLVVADAKGNSRFAFTLGEKPAAPAAVEDGVVPSPAEDPVEAETRPRLESAASVRVLVWPRKSGRIRYRLDSGSWADAAEPVAVPVAGCEVEWLVDRGATFSGPYAATVRPAAAASAEFGSKVALSFRPPTEDETSSARPRGSALEGDGIVLDVCDGEELTWSARSRDGTFSESRTVDRRAPEPPRLFSPDEGSWIAAPTELRVQGGEATAALAEWTDGDGTAKRISFDSVFLPPASPDGPTRYRVSAWSQDPAGNRSPVVVRSFTVDSSTVYASSSATRNGGADGSRDKPFSSLAKALDVAASQGRRRVVASGAFALDAAFVARRDLSVEGGYGPDWKPATSPSRLDLGDRASLSASGARLRVSGFQAMSRSSAPPLQALAGGWLELDSLFLSSAAPLSAAPSSTLSLSDCVVRVASASGSAVGIDASGADVRAVRSRIEATRSGAAAGGFSATGIAVAAGRVSLREVLVSVACAGAAFGIEAKSSDLAAEGSTVSAAGGSYASALILSGAAAVWSGGSLRASARDVAAVSSKSAGARFEDCEIAVEASGVARGIDAEAPFPAVTACRFVYSGSARGSEALAGASPRAGSMGGNVFEGFRYIYGKDFESEDAAAFERRFSAAAPGATIPQPRSTP